MNTTIKADEGPLIRLADELNVRLDQVRAAAQLLDGGATVPFIARYRKEATGALDDTQLRLLSTRLVYLRELDDRRQAILRSVETQGKLSDALRAELSAATTLQALEDLYAPYKPQRRTKAQAARDAGLEPLADLVLGDLASEPYALAAAFVSPDAGFADAAAVLDGVRDLLADRWANDAHLLGSMREWLWSEAELQCRLVAGRRADDSDAARLRDYHDHREPIRLVPSHRALAMLRGRAQALLDLKLVLNADAAPGTPSPGESRIARHIGWRHEGRPGDGLIGRSVAWTWKVKLSLSLERDLLARMRDAAEIVAIRIFAENLRDLLLAAPAGKRVVMGLDPGIRTGVKVAVVGETGRVIDTATIYPHEPRRDVEGSQHTLSTLIAKHNVTLVAIGNGTASRETDRLVADMLRRLREREGGCAVERIVISEAGASVYSASELASRELPELDVSLRGAVSIARRLQDPLAELVKIDPKSIGVGQYQHDLNATLLARQLDAVVEDCVNHVGVELNTASPALLARVAGLSAALAAAVVQWRDENGGFIDRSQLLQVKGLGPKTFEQAAGFLRIRGGSNPLDTTGVHPETYPLVQRMLQRLGRPIGDVMGRADVLRTLDAPALADDRFGAMTVRDILVELEKPGRDPRPAFRTARFDEAVSELADLRAGMRLEGTVSNVAQFGAFVDIGVHQDGLIHVSQLSHRFVRDAREVVKVGDVVQVRVLEVDLQRKRVALTMRLDAEAQAAAGVNRFLAPNRGSQRPTGRSDTPVQGSMAVAFERLRTGR